MMIFDGQVALVTGASRGIGRAVLSTLAKAGAYVIGTATGETGVATIKAHINDVGAAGTGLVLDLADPASIQAFTEALGALDKAPSILVNNAGVTRDNLLIRMQDDEWDAVININLRAVYLITKLCLRGMMKARYGRIINMTSVVGMTGNAGQSNYAASKAGVIGFTRALAKEVGSRTITVNAIAPGFIDTDMTARLDATQRDALIGQTALGRFGEVDEIAQVAKFLASLDAGYITGETIHVNGGLYMG